MPNENYTPGKKYSIIAADCPWSYKVWSKKGEGRSAESHYQTMDRLNIQSLEISKLAAKDCVLFMWVTAPCLVEGLETLKKWGFCVAPKTKVITKDLRWVEAGDLKEGDELLSFDEESKSSNHTHRHFNFSKVVSTGRKVLPCYKITLEDGKEMTCSDEHSWLVRTSNGVKNPKVCWVKTKDLPKYLNNKRRKGPLYLQKLLPDVDFDETYNSGFLSGAFDGEGSVHIPSAYLTFTQNDNALLDEVRKILQIEGYKFNENSYINKCGNKYSAITIHHFDLFKFLIKSRPPRLIKKFTESDVNKLSIYSRQKTAISSVEFVGEQEVVSLQTSSGTYITEGYGSHNTYKTIGFNWVKRNKKSPSWFWGMGYWTRANSELCLIATRGNPKRISASVHQVLDDAVMAHSQKPDTYLERIEQLMGDLPRVELFARRRRDGWDAIGNEIDGKDIRDVLKEW